MKKQKVFIAPLVWIAVLLLVVILGSYFYLNQQNKNSVTTTIVKSDKPSINILTDETDQENNVAKAVILSDRSFNVFADIHRDYSFFGYSKPDVTSDKLIIFSVFTDDVENNPLKLELGAYYGTDSSIPFNFKYLDMDGNFVRIVATDTSGNKHIIFFEKKWVEFTNK